MIAIASFRYRMVVQARDGLAGLRDLDRRRRLEPLESQKMTMPGPTCSLPFPDLRNRPMSHRHVP